MAQDVTASVASQIEAVRIEIEGRGTITQREVDAWLDEFGPFKDSLQPGESDEQFDLVDPDGKPTGAVAPRWLCHSVGLRHRSVHVLLKWRGRGLQAVVLQIRSATKSNSPLHLDISVGGHVKAGTELEEAAYEEMHEELGLTKHDLGNGRISEILKYTHYDKQPGNRFFNQEYCVVYEGYLDTLNLDSLALTDGEVGGLYLCPEDQLGLLRDQAPCPMASALQEYLTRCGRR